MPGLSAPQLGQVKSIQETPPRTGRSLLRNDVAVITAVFLAFGAGAVLSWESFGSWGGPSFFYPSAGVTVAAMILNRRALWPAIAAAVAVAEFLVDTWYGGSLDVSAAFAAANVVEPLIGASLVLAWCGGRPDLGKRPHFVVFIVGACLIAPVFGALIGGTASSRHDGTPWLGATFTWWAGDALGVLVMASPILLWPLQNHIIRRRPLEMVAVLLVTALLSIGTFSNELPPTMLILPVLAWAAFRLDMLGASIAGAVAAFLGNIMTTHGHGLFADTGRSQSAQVSLTQIYVAVIVVVAMLIAQEAAARLNAVREREAERRERIRLETLSRLALELSAALTPDDIGQALAGQVLNEAGAKALSLGLVNSDARTLEWIAHAGYSPRLVDEFGADMPLTERGVACDAIRLNRPIEIRHAADYAATYPEKGARPKYFAAESIVGWPLAAGGRSFGVLLLMWSETQPFDEAQRAYMSAVATMVSQALVRAKVYADERARAEVLHSVAQPVEQVDVVGLEYNALYRPADAAHGLGGDWYSVMALPDDRTYLAVGDVVGHGLASVEDMAQLRSTSDAYAHQGLPPAQILSELNRFAVHQIRGEFATSLVAIFDPARNCLTYSSAGHLPALLRRAVTGEVIRLSDASGPMVGPFDDSEYVGSSILVKPGDVLVMYTDGLVEHHDEGVMAGIDHLEQALTAWPPEALLDCEALAQDVAPILRADDICLLVVRFGNHGGK